MSEIGKGDPRFYDVLYRIAALHDRKQADYGSDADPFANVRASEDFGIPGWVGAIVRGNDKMKRLQKAARGGVLANESIEDSLMDLAVYAIIGMVLHQEFVADARAILSDGHDYGYAAHFNVDVDGTVTQNTPVDHPALWDDDDA